MSSRLSIEISTRVGLATAHACLPEGMLECGETIRQKKKQQRKKNDSENEGNEQRPNCEGETRNNPLQVTTTRCVHNGRRTCERETGPNSANDGFGKLPCSGSLPRTYRGPNTSDDARRRGVPGNRLHRFAAKRQPPSGPQRLSLRKSKVGLVFEGARSPTLPRLGSDVCAAFPVVRCERR